MTRRHYIERIQDKLGDRKLIWVGTRGHDAIGLMDIPQFSEVYSIAAPLGSLSLNADLALEQLTRKRVDLDTYVIDQDLSEEANELRRCLLASLTEPTCVASYRSLALLSASCFPRSEFVTHLGMFHERQATFEHKPWVETELKNANIPVIPWRYFANEDRLRLEEELLAQSVLVLRFNRSDGGAGLGSVKHPDEIRAYVSHLEDGFLAAAPLLDPHVPLNVNACVFPTGEVTLHPASVQLIGIEGCTRRRFGYCGNDFAAIQSLNSKILDRFEDVTRRTGAWLHSQGYVGAFGVDALVHRNEIYLTEVNPRFQGSSALAARIDREIDWPDIYLCHLASFLGIAPPAPAPTLRDRVKVQPAYAQIIQHNCKSVPVRQEQSMPEGLDYEFELEIAPAMGVDVNPDAILLRLITRRAVTEDGCSVDPTLLRRWGVSRSLVPTNIESHGVGEDAEWTRW